MTAHILTWWSRVHDLHYTTLPQDSGRGRTAVDGAYSLLSDAPGEAS